MLFSKNFAAGLVLALGLFQDAVTASTPSCCTNQCGKAVGLNKNGKKDCSAVLIKTVMLPTVTTTRHVTVTHTLVRHGLKIITPSTLLVATATLSETDVSISTSLSTDIETAFSTDISTVFETEFSTTTIPFPVPTITTTQVVVGKRTVCSTKPAYARTCDSNAYTRACSCMGVKPYTVTKPAPRKTVYRTLTAYTTIHTTATSIAPAITNTNIVTVTSFTTIISGTEIVETSTVTVATEIATTVTDVVVATETADPVPPTCTGMGFVIKANSPGQSPPNGYGIGWITRVDDSGNIVNWYPSDFTMVVATDAAPYKVMFESNLGNVHYAFPTQPASCGISSTDFQLACKVGTADYKAAFCRDPVYYDWYVWLYNDASQLAGMQCVTDALFAQC
ncbi:hypothetical protein ABW21_db0209582 [Orbilia brochopaga]|nr:hypothetical protein ABW21_db0209582 [Drechslerella brochopaga]